MLVSHELGSLATEQGEPVLIQWRWYDNAPMLPLWFGLALLLIVPRPNRHWQAWTILALPLPAAALQLFFFVPGLGESAGFDAFVQFTVTLAIAWSAVWLLVPYLATGHRAAAFFSAMAVMLAAGLVAYVGYFGALVSWEHLHMVGLWCVGSVGLVGGLLLSGFTSRTDFHPGRLALWLLLWLPLMTAAGLVVFFGAMFLPMAGHLGVFMLVAMAVSVVFSTVFLAGFLYAVNAPVLFLAGLTDCYGGRMRRLVLQEPPTCNHRADADPADSPPPPDRRDSEQQIDE